MQVRCGKGMRWPRRSATECLNLHPIDTWSQAVLCCVCFACSAAPLASTHKMPGVHTSLSVITSKNVSGHAPCLRVGRGVGRKPVDHWSASTTRNNCLHGSVFSSQHQRRQEPQELRQITPELKCAASTWEGELFCSPPSEDLVEKDVAWDYGFNHPPPSPVWPKAISWSPT